MEFISGIFGAPLGWIMYWFYNATNNYILSLFLFTLVTRVILIPMVIKQQKSSVKMMIIKPQMDELQKKYKGNRERLNQELMDLYKREGYNPASGCLPMLVQLPILFGLIDVIYRPLTHIIRIPEEVIRTGESYIENVITGPAGVRIVQLNLLQEVQAYPERFIPAMGQGFVDAIVALDMSFMGINLTIQPSLDMLRPFDPVIIVPIMAGITSLFFTMVMSKVNPAAMSGSAAGSMKAMLYTMPIISTVFTFSIPAGVGVYWTFTNIVGVAQSLLMNRIYNPREMAEKAKQETAQRKEQERHERIEAKKLKREGIDDGSGKALSQKEMNRKKLAEARKREAEQYGESYEDED